MDFSKIEEEDVIFFNSDEDSDVNNDYDDDDPGGDEDDDFEWSSRKTGHRNPHLKTGQGYNSQANNMTSGNNSGNLKKLESKINLEKYTPKVANQIHKTESKEEMGKIRIKDKQDRATMEQVLDPRNRMILLKMINRGFLESVNGCVSTGKEANVYHAATKTPGVDRAIKIYRTSILSFKDRDKYVSGGYRFRHGYCRKNPRKMVRTWAEKEMRNLTRIHACAIPCPQPFMLRNHVLVMEFLGVEGVPSPLLKDVSLNESTARQLYLECILIIRRMYKDARLVHADLSEFNLLYHRGSIVVIDVSQAVEHDHPRAVDFLRKDCCNMNHFFRKNGVLTLTLRELFDFVTDPNLLDEDVDRYLEKLQESTSGRSLAELESLEKETEEQIFLHSYLPKRLDEVIDFEQDMDRVQKKADGEEDELIYRTITGLKADLSGAQTKSALLNEEESCSDEDSSETETDGEEEEEEETDKKKAMTPVRPRNETAEERKERKRAVKEERREKRKEKDPKHVKKRLNKMAKKK